MVSKEDKAVIIGIAAFIVFGLIAYFGMKLGWYSTLAIGCVACAVASVLSYRLLSG